MDIKTEANYKLLLKMGLDENQAMAAAAAANGKIELASQAIATLKENNQILADAAYNLMVPLQETIQSTNGEYIPIYTPLDTEQKEEG
jgi:hypothetical protein